MLFQVGGFDQHHAYPPTPEGAREDTVGRWGHVSHILPVSSRGDEGFRSISADVQLMLITRVHCIALSRLMRQDPELVKTQLASLVARLEAKEAKTSLDELLLRTNTQYVNENYTLTSTAPSCSTLHHPGPPLPPLSSPCPFLHVCWGIPRGGGCCLLFLLIRSAHRRG